MPMIKRSATAPPNAPPMTAALVRLSLFARVSPRDSTSRTDVTVDDNSVVKSIGSDVDTIDDADVGVVVVGRVLDVKVAVAGDVAVTVRFVVGLMLAIDGVLVVGLVDVDDVLLVVVVHVLAKHSQPALVPLQLMQFCSPTPLT